MLDIAKLEKTLQKIAQNEKDDKNLLLQEVCSQLSPDSLGFDGSDYCRAMSYKGKMCGYSGLSFIEDLYDDITANIDTKDFLQAKIFLLSITMNPDILPSSIDNVLNKLHHICSNDCDSMVETQKSSSLDKDIVHYKILLTGLDG